MNTKPKFISQNPNPKLFREQSKLPLPTELPESYLAAKRAALIFIAKSQYQEHAWDPYVSLFKSILPDFAKSAFRSAAIDLYGECY